MCLSSFALRFLAPTLCPSSPQGPFAPVHILRRARSHTRVQPYIHSRGKHNRALRLCSPDEEVEVQRGNCPRACLQLGAIRGGLGLELRVQPPWVKGQGLHSWSHSGTAGRLSSRDFFASCLLPFQPREGSWDKTALISGRGVSSGRVPGPAAGGAPCLVLCAVRLLSSAEVCAPDGEH